MTLVSLFKMLMSCCDNPNKRLGIITQCLYVSCTKDHFLFLYFLHSLLKIYWVDVFLYRTLWNAVLVMHWTVKPLCYSYSIYITTEIFQVCCTELFLQACCFSFLFILAISVCYIVFWKTTEKCEIMSEFSMKCCSNINCKTL